MEVVKPTSSVAIVTQDPNYQEGLRRDGDDGRNAKYYTY